MPGVCWAAPPLPGASPVLPQPGDFVTGQENLMALAALETVLESGLDAGELAVLHGPPESGKTHLVGLLARAWQELFPEQRVEIARAVDFRRQLGHAIEHKAVRRFRERYWQARLVVLENIHHLLPYPAAVNELRQMLDGPLQHETTVVLTSRESPWAMRALPASLQTRLVAAHCVPVSLPGPEARALLLSQTADQLGIQVSRAAVEYLADELSGSADRIRGWVHQRLLDRRNRTTVDLKTAKQLLKEHRQATAISLTQIAQTTARAFQIPMSKLRGRERQRDVVLARDVAMYLALELTEHTLQQIGSYFGGRDHKTVSHGCNKIDGMMKIDNGIRETVDTLRQSLLLESGYS